MFSYKISFVFKSLRVYEWALTIDGREAESAYWFGHQYDTPASLGDHETLNSMVARSRFVPEVEELKDEVHVGLDMFMGAPESHYLLSQFGFNTKWEISNNQTLVFDFSSAVAEQNPDGEFNINKSDVQAVPIDLRFDTRNGIATHFYEDQVLSLENAKLHQQDAYSNHNKDELNQIRIDYSLEGDTANLKAGLMYTDQTKAITGYSTNRNESGQEDGKAYSFRSIFPLVGDFDYDWDGPTTYDDDGNVTGGDQYEMATFHGLYATAADAEAAGYGIEHINHAFAGDVSFITFDPNAAYSWIDTLSQKPDFESLDLVKHSDWYEVNEKTVAAYVELTAEVELADRPLTLVAGTRVEQTSIDSTSLETTLTGLSITPEDAASTTAENMRREFTTSPYTDGDDYMAFLPTLSLKYELSDDLVLRFASSRTITRPELSNMRSSRNFGDIRSDREAGKGSSGNPDLKPYVSDNLDFSVEWYLDEASYLSAGLFQKVVDNFIVSYAVSEEIEGVINPSTGEDVVYDITRPQNQDTKKIHGMELAAQYSFADTGFGVIANATIVDTDSPFETDQIDASAVIGLSDSANLIAFYDNNGIQARIAYNWRDAFVEKFGHTYSTTTGEPTQVDSYGQIDLSASYDLTDTMTVFFEGINLTSEEVYKYSRFDNQFLYTQTNSARYALGIRASF